VPNSRASSKVHARNVGSGLTLYTAPRSFRGPVAEAQLRAIRSWQRLQPACEILLLGDEDGMVDAARALGVRHIPRIDRNEFGTPLVSSIIQIAEAEGRGDILCYINADIILTQSFAHAVAAMGRERFLMVGRRRDLDPSLLPDIDDPRWEERLVQAALNAGRLHEATGIDYFVHSRGLWPLVPPFALGRTMWDNWLVFAARRDRIPVIDASDCVYAIHQNHGYSHHVGGEEGVFKGAEAVRNLELGGGYGCAFTIDDATHVVVNGKPKLAIDVVHVRQRNSRISVLYPWTRIVTRPIEAVARPAIRLMVRTARSFRERSGKSAQ
jgi:hypothetical protein